jgi:hypothetical protein
MEGPNPIPTCTATHAAQARDRDRWTCLHHALSLPDPSPAAAAWIDAALALPGVALLRETALRDIASVPAVMPATALELHRGDTNAAQVMLIACQA